MNINQIYTDLQSLNDLIVRINQREQGAINELNRLHRLLFGDVVTATCSNCHIKAFHRLTSLTIKDLENMENQKFKIKKGKLIEYPFRSGQFFSSVKGITNDQAVEFLTNHPEKVDHFEVYPGSETEGKELDLSEFISPIANETEGKELDLSKMNKVGLQAEYLKVFGVDADESLTKAQLKEAIENKD